MKYWYGYNKRLTPRHLGRVLGTPKPCSCRMCGNPRKYFGERSVQEKRLDDALSHDDYAIRVGCA